MSTTRKFTLLTRTEKPESPNPSAGIIVCRDLREDADFYNLNFAHLAINVGFPVRNPRLGGIWMKSLAHMMIDDRHGCFPAEWRNEGFILRGTEYLDADGNLCVVKFIYERDVWRRAYIPIPTTPGRELIFKQTAGLA